MIDLSKIQTPEEMQDILIDLFTKSQLNAVQITDTVKGLMEFYNIVSDTKQSEG